MATADVAELVLGEVGEPVIDLRHGDHTVLAGWTLTLVHTLEGRGLDGAEMARVAGIPDDTLASADRRVPARASVRFWERAVEATGDPVLGLAVARQVRPATFHVLSQAVLASATLRDGLERIAAYGTMVADHAALGTVRDDEGFALTLGWKPGAPRPAVAALDAVMATILLQCRVIAGPVSPRLVHLERPVPDDPSPYLACFGCPVVFGARDNRLVFETQDVDRVLPAGDVALARANDDVLDAYLASLHTSPMRRRVREVLVGMPSGDEPTATAVARTLHISPRSLQRHLQAEGTTFRELLAEVRRDLAEAYLRSGRWSVREVSHLLGFSETAAFSRAFKRWTGVAPSQFT